MAADPEKRPPGSLVYYRSISGDVYDAIVRGTRLDGSLDIDVFPPGATAFPLHHIKTGEFNGQICGYRDRAGVARPLADP